MGTINSNWHTVSPRMTMTGSFTVETNGLDVRVYGNLDNSITPGYWGYYGYTISGWVDLDGGTNLGGISFGSGIEVTSSFDTGWHTVGAGGHTIYIRISCGDGSCSSSAFNVEVGRESFTAVNPETPAGNNTVGAIHSNLEAKNQGTITEYSDGRIKWDWSGEYNGTPESNYISYHNIDCYPSNDVNSAYSVAETDHYTKLTWVSMATLMQRYNLNIGDTLYCWVNTCLNSGAWLGRVYCGAVRIIPYPPSCTGLSVTSTTTTSGTISADFNPRGARITNYEFGYRNVNSSSWTTQTQAGSSTATSGTISAGRTFTDLTPNTRYEVRVRAYNEAGWGEYKSGIYFWTKPLANTPTISCTARGITTATVVLTKNPTNYPDINLYDVQYKKSSTTTWTDLADQSSGTFSLTGLSSNTVYNIRGRTRTGTGGDGTTAWSGYSSTGTFYTLPSAGTATVSCVRNNTQNSLNIIVNTGGTYTPAANTYQIRYRQSGASSWITLNASTNQTQTISNLTAGNTYEIQGRARTAIGVDGSSTAWSEWSSSISIRVVKAGVLTLVEPNVSFTASSTQVQVKVSYTNNYPNANRIYYALTPATVSNPGPVSGMFFATSSSPTTITISKDYLGNALTADTTYKLWVYVNQYKANSEWYASGLDLYSNVLEEYVVTTPVVGTLSNVSCVRNNTYNSLVISATKSGTWSSYAGWEYRYKVSTAADSTYSDWSTTSTSNKTISGLTPGQTYKIQVRGSTGTTSAGSSLYSTIYELTIRVAKRPAMTLKIYRIKENEIGVQGTITDNGYPAVTSLNWMYSSNSYITNTYVPNTLINSNIVTFGSTIATSQNYIFKNLYHFALYDVRARLVQSNSSWYSAGIDNNTDFIIENVELALYNNRTERVKANNNGWKVVSSIKGWNGSSWKDAGTNKEPTAGLDSYQIWGNTNIGTISSTVGWFYVNGNEQGNNTAASNVNIWVPGIDRVRFKGNSVDDNAYGGNLFDNKLSLNLGTMQTANTDTTSPYLYLNTSYFNFTRELNSISCKVKTAIPGAQSDFINIFAIAGLSRLVDMNLIDTMYLEMSTDVLPSGSDPNYTAGPYIKYIPLEDQSQKLAEHNVPVNASNGSRILAVIPVAKLLELGLGYKFDRIDFYSCSTNQNANCLIRSIDSILNISNFNIFYTLR